MNANHPGLTRAGAASIGIARRLLLFEPGARLQTVAQYARELGSGVGTVQRALKMLEDGGAITLQTRGRLGTYQKGLRVLAPDARAKAERPRCQLESLLGSEPMGRGSRSVRRWRNDRKRKKNERETRKLAAVARASQRR